MDWPFVGRSEALEQIRQAIGSPAPRPLLVVGEPGAGRTTLVERALAHVDPSRDVVIHPRPRGTEPFGALHPLLPNDFGARPVCARVIEEATALLAAHVGDRRPVVIADDAHRIDLASMLVLRGLHRQAGAVLLLTQPACVGGGPDAIDCVRYEPGMRTIALTPLTSSDVHTVLVTVLSGPVHDGLVAAVHAATGGHPARLRELVQRGNLRDKVEPVDGALRLAEPGRERILVADRDRLLGAVRQAWSALALEPLAELCKLATWCGAGAQVALVHAEALLFSGDPAGALRVLDRATGEPGQVAFLRALGRALTGLPAAVAGVSPARLAWILAATGDVGGASAVLAESVVELDREAAAFRQAAVALVARERDGWPAAIGPLRKALVLAEAQRDELPWLPPYLRAQLIDVLLLSGRAGEATAMAAEFHASVPSAGWGMAVSLALALPRATG